MAERLMQMETNFSLGMNGGYKPSGLGGRLIVVVRLTQAVNM